MDVIIFSIDGQYFALDLAIIHRVVLAAEITPLPHAPEIIMGAINIQGVVTPVINMRKVLGFPGREVELNDQMILCGLHGKTMALWVDGVIKIGTFGNEQLIPANQVLTNSDGVEHVIKDQGRLILLYDLEQLLSSQESSLSTMKVL